MNCRNMDKNYKKGSFETKYLYQIQYVSADRPKAMDVSPCAGVAGLGKATLS